ncbi:hypothetical protein HDU76_002717 [Blyttiomyces sp. JEL0837]|nr:hypothetical protein HDU76_002717 [Blyttiomyces sp. JEL0837]
MSITRNETTPLIDDREELGDKPLPGKWHERVAAVLETKTVHWGVLLLTILDLFIVGTEIVVSIEDRCKLEERDEPVILEFLHIVSTAILFLFVFELSLRAYCFGLKYFTTSNLHMFDATVVILSLIFDLALKGWAEEFASLLIILRLWRVVRVIDGVAVTLEENTKEELAALKAENHKLRAELEEARLLISGV